MSDTTRDDLAQLIAGHCYETREAGECHCREEFHGIEAWAEHLAELIDAEHLTVPRSGIVGTEYGR